MHTSRTLDRPEFILAFAALTLLCLAIPGISHAQCGARALNSHENEVARAYLAYYGRAPDATGLAYWADRLEGEGGNLDAIIDAFGVSTEFDDRFGDLSDADLVNNLFQQQFGRDADPAGLDFYVGELRAGRMSLQTISLNIIYGAQNEDVTIVENRLAVSAHYVTLAESNSNELSAGAIFSMLDGVFDPGTSTAACEEIGDAFNVEETLFRLGVDSRETKRRGASGEDLPDDYAPLGPRRTLDKSSELFMAGLIPLGDTETSMILDYQPGVDTPGTFEKLAGLSATPAWRASPYNAAAPGDIDGDGFDEIVLLWWSPNNRAISIALVDDASEGFAETEPVNLLTADPSRLAIVAGDFDGDTRDDVVIGVIDSAAGTVELYVLEGNKQDGFRASGPSLSYAATQTASTLGIEFAAGNLDRDPGLELVVVTNETWGSGQNGSPGAGVSHYRIYDQVTVALTEQAGERVSVFTDGKTYDGLTATPALGDLDGDNLDEVVIAAITEAFPTTCDPIITVQLALDDLDSGMESLGASVQTLRIPNCESSGNNGWTSHLWADSLDMDDDPYSELHVNGIVYDDFVNTPPFTRKVIRVGDDEEEEVQIPARNIFAEQGNNQRLRTTWQNTSLRIGDVSADGLDDIIVYMPGRVPLRQVDDGRTSFWETGYAVTAWGIDPLTGEWGQRWYYELEGRHQDEDDYGPPVALAANMDADSTILRFSRGTHRVIFTEPVVLAALAAPPCHGDGTQVTDVCQTSWGTGSSQGASASISHEITARHHFGYNASVSLPVIGDLGTEVEQSVGLSVAAEASLGYEITKTVTYTTGPMEDTVVALVIPYDQYSYEILSHPIYPELVGTDVVVSLPRSPRTIQIERQFFNDAVVGSGSGIGSNVFAHTIGEVMSYPNRSQMLAAVSNGASSIGPVDVGASRGSTSVEISESLTAGFTASVTVSYETSVKSTAGPAMTGYSVGTSTTASLGLAVGSSVTFSGTVGDMPPERFDLDKAYSYGLYAYKQAVPGTERTFQVINYWVE